MKKHRIRGMVLPTVSVLVGRYLQHKSTTNSQWYLDFYLIAVPPDDRVLGDPTTHADQEIGAPW